MFTLIRIFNQLDFFFYSLCTFFIFVLFHSFSCAGSSFKQKTYCVSRVFFETAFCSVKQFHFLFQRKNQSVVLFLGFLCKKPKTFFFFSLQQIFFLRRARKKHSKKILKSKTQYLHLRTSFFVLHFVLVKKNISKHQTTNASCNKRTR